MSEYTVHLIDTGHDRVLNTAPLRPGSLRAAKDAAFLRSYSFLSADLLVISQDKKPVTWLRVGHKWTEYCRACDASGELEYATGPYPWDTNSQECPVCHGQGEVEADKNKTRSEAEGML